MRLWLQLWLQEGMKSISLGRFDAGTALLYEAEKVENRLEKGLSEGGKISLAKTRSRLDLTIAA